MKKITLSFSFILIAICTFSQIRITYVEPSTNTIKVKNFGASTVDISGYRLCSLIKYTSNLTTGITINSGSMNLAAGEEVEFVAPGGASSSWQNLANEADLGLYLPSGSFGSSSAMVDFVQWGSGGHGRESVAVSKGIWNTGDFVSDTEPFFYTGDGTQNGVFFWEGTTPPNQAPTDITLSNSTIEENMATNTVVGVLTTEDPDTEDNHTYTLVVGAGSDDNTSFTISGAELLSNEVFDFELKSVYSIRIQTDDGNSNTFEKSFSITITNDAEPPSDISLSNQSIGENSTIGSVVGILSTTDPDMGESYVYSLSTGTGDDDNASFEIVGDELRTFTQFDFENKSMYSVRIQTNDGENTFSKPFSITIVDENDFPTDITLSNNTIDENQAIGTIIGNLSTTDINVGDTHSYSLVEGEGGTDNSLFAIVDAELQSASIFNHESKDVLSIRIQTDDENGGVFSEIFSIVVSDLVEAPTGLVLSSHVIAENQPISTQVGIFTTIDEDQGENYTYDFIAGTGDDDNASFQISNNQLLSNEVFDLNVKSSYSIRVATNDGNTNSFEETFTITVTPANDAPTDIILSNNVIDENQDIGFTIGTLTTNDANENDSHTYLIVTGVGDSDNNSFAIDNNLLITSEVFNFETKSSYTVRIQTTDSEGASFSKAFSIDVNDVSESPTDISLSNQELPENQSSGFTIGMFTSTDEDAGESYTYSLANGEGDSDNSLFEIVGANLLSDTTFDFETKSVYTIRVETNDSNLGTFSKSFSISITDTNDAPTDITLSNSVIAENEEAGTLIGTLTSADQDVNDTHFYSLVAGDGDDDNGIFIIQNGQLSINEIGNFESKSTYSIRVESNDGNEGVYSKSFIIELEDVPEAPTDIAISNSTIQENLPSGSTIGILTAIDEDLEDSFTFSLIAGAGSENNESFEIDGSALKSNEALNYEELACHSIRIQATDNTGGTFSKIFLIEVENINEAPTELILSASAVSTIDEIGSEVGVLSSIDEDENDGFTYSLVEGDGDDHNALFSIEVDKLLVNAPLSNSLPDELSVRISSTDIGNLSVTSVFTIEVEKILGFEKLEAVKVFPNPVSEYFQIIFHEPIQNEQIKIIDLNGKVVFTELLTSGSEFLIQNLKLSPGLYQLQISLKGNTAHRSIVIE
ncbi:T9SS type A sorting domain-containing protein [Ekhidna sp.]|uniref:T9SS type A sorting domain-containing protein n=1 Tax=Ekhidna sp. TaxID=2608089 RepID=UPI003B50EE8E